MHVFWKVQQKERFSEGWGPMFSQSLFDVQGEFSRELVASAMEALLVASVSVAPASLLSR